MPVDTEDILVCPDCRTFLANGDLPNDFPEFHANVDEVDPDDVDWHPAHIHGEYGCFPSALGWRLSVVDGQSDEHSIYNCESCNAGAGPRFRAKATRPAMKVVVQYGSDCSDEAGKSVNPWGLGGNTRGIGQSVTLYCNDVSRAYEDQTVLGSSWEVSEGGAYTSVIEFARDGVCSQLRAEGYAVSEDQNTVPLHT
jgi:uncharacterized protein YbaR (Trm112 family)